MKNSAVIRPNGAISSEQARGLLRRFRDLNLGPCGIDLSESERVVVAGCLSLDHPVERGVRYGLLRPDGSERVLAMHWEERMLVVRLRTGPEADSHVEEKFDVELGCDSLGRVSAPDLGARMHLDQSNAKDVEHFLRRIVRAVHSHAG